MIVSQEQAFKMNARLIVIFGLVTLIGADFEYDDEITTKSLVRRHGYPFESHTVETKDGYILSLHRIPFSPYQEPSNQQEQKSPIAFLMHGLSSSSSDWVMLGPGRALAYKLSDAGYDVWMGNARGNVYSFEHIKYDPNEVAGKFWDFSWHEIGTEDLPASIDYIRNETGQDKMTYFAHSQGTTAFFVMSSLHETYQNYIKSAHLLTPYAFAEDLSNIFLKAAGNVIALTNPLATLVTSTEFRPNGTITKLAGAALCYDKPSVLCSNIIFLVAGFNNITVDPSIISDVLAATPAGASTKCVLHYFQMHNSNSFQQYDYGLLGNLAIYKSSKPPNYPLENINVPLFLYPCEEDRLVHKPDIDRIVKSVSNVWKVLTIKGATHESPVYGVDSITEPLYDMVLKDAASLK